MPSADDGESAGAQVQEIAARDAIRQLRHESLLYLDSRRWEEFRALFSNDPSVTFHGTDQPTIRGANGIREWCEAIESEFKFTFHMIHQPVIEVDDESATGSWYFETATQSADSATLRLGTYEDDYILSDDGWNIDRIQVDVRSHVESPVRWQPD